MSSLDLGAKSKDLVVESEGSGFFPNDRDLGVKAKDLGVESKDSGLFPNDIGSCESVWAFVF